MSFLHFTHLAEPSGFWKLGLFLEIEQRKMLSFWYIKIIDQSLKITILKIIFWLTSYVKKTHQVYTGILKELMLHSLI